MARQQSTMRRFFELRKCSGASGMLAAALLLVAVGTPENARAITCSRATSSTEAAICRDETLNALDDELNRAYRSALAHGADRGELIAQQRKWLDEIRDRCEDTACLTNAYSGRLRELARFQGPAAEQPAIAESGLQLPPNDAKSSPVASSQHAAELSTHDEEQPQRAADAVSERDERSFRTGGSRATATAPPELPLRASETKLAHCGDIKFPTKNQLLLSAKSGTGIFAEQKVRWKDLASSFENVLQAEYGVRCEQEFTSCSLFGSKFGAWIEAINEERGPLGDSANSDSIALYEKSRKQKLTETPAVFQHGDCGQEFINAATALAREYDEALNARDSTESARKKLIDDAKQRCERSADAQRFEAKELIDVALPSKRFAEAALAHEREIEEASGVADLAAKRQYGQQLVYANDQIKAAFQIYRSAGGKEDSPESLAAAQKLPNPCEAKPGSDAPAI